MTHEPCPVCGANYWVEEFIEMAHVHCAWIFHICQNCYTAIHEDHINDRTIRWVNVKDRLPEAKKTVYAEVQYKHHKEFVAICYIPPRTVLPEDFLWDFDDTLAEYDEDSDKYWVLEGWFETSFEQEMNYAISGTVIRWLEDKTEVSE